MGAGIFIFPYFRTQRECCHPVGAQPSLLWTENFMANHLHLEFNETQQACRAAKCPRRRYFAARQAKLVQTQITFRNASNVGDCHIPFHPQIWNTTYIP
jgi:hypothetical protein